MLNFNLEAAIKQFLWYAFIVLLAIGISSKVGFSWESKEPKKVPSLFVYSKKDVARFLKEIGHPEFAEKLKTSWDITRNSDGTALRFFDWDNRKGLVVNCCDGSINELNISGDSAWFNDENQPVAWMKDRIVYYKNGETDKPPFRKLDADPGGNYFVKGEGCVRIFSIENPKVPLAEVNLLGTGVLRIFSKGDKVYVFDHARDSKNNEKIPLKAYVLQKAEHSLTILKEIIIPLPSGSSDSLIVVDLSPWSDIVLLCHYFDWPSRSKWYEFNLETNEMTKIGPTDGWGFYLQCDIIKERRKTIGVRSTHLTD